ncbi:TetR/AcrR family transcriptional regulator [bacterium]|nr:TetR/AcrR family transcriptional regulator [bacterium]HPF36357.1 TetR/AcrR family transcriptional regulator [Candidatus Krumholzibacteria bacterium]HRX52229.1 TetR/AcrR family transcriptional regulator [Candidatus Krumholzibacteria bacterium]
MAPHDVERRAQLFGAALPIFERFGYRKSTVEEICREAGMSKRTFYEEFRDKADFFGHLVLHQALGLLDRWREETAQEPTAAARLEALVDMYIHACIHTPVLQCMFENDESREAVDRAFTVENVKPLAAAMVPVMEQGMATGELRPHDPEITARIIGLLLDSVFIILPQMFRECRIETDEAFVREMKAFIVHGLLAR